MGEKRKNILAMQSDEALMELVKDRDQNAFEELYNRYSRKLLLFLYKLTGGNENLAQDLLQDTFVRIIDKADTFDRNRKLSSWLYTIALNLSKNEKRRIVTQSQKHDIIRNQLKYVSNEHEQKEEELDRQFLKRLINKELDLMKIENKSILLLRFQDNLSINEISEIMNLPEGTVKSRIFYLIRRLSARIKTQINYE